MKEEIISLWFEEKKQKPILETKDEIIVGKTIENENEIMFIFQKVDRGGE
jgi:hypothetical protein